MANKHYYKITKTMDPDLKNGRPGTQYYHSFPSSQELYRAAKFASDWCQNIDILFEDHLATSTWYITPWPEIRRETRAKKGKDRTPEEAIAELYYLMTKSIHKWMATLDYGMPCPCWDKWNLVIQHGFDLIARNDFEYAEEMKIEWIQTHNGKKPLNNIKDLIDSN